MTTDNTQWTRELIMNEDEESCRHYGKILYREWWIEDENQAAFDSHIEKYATLLRGIITPVYITPSI